MAKATIEYYLVLTEHELAQCVSYLETASVIAVDLETTGLDATVDKVVGVSLSTKEGLAWYIPVGHTIGEQLPIDVVGAALKAPLENTSKRIIMHNAKFDTRFLSQLGITISYSVIDDTLLEAFVAAETHRLQRYGLKGITEVLYNHKQTDFKELFPRGTKVFNIATVPIDVVASYACEDADYTFRVDSRYYNTVQGSFIYKLERALWPCTQLIEDTGFPASVELMEASAVYILDQAEVVKGIILDMVEKAIGVRIEFDLSKPVQVREMLYTRLGLPIKVKTKGGSAATSEEALEKLSGQYPICSNVLAYRSMLSTAGSMGTQLLNFVGEDGRIHTQYNQAGAPSGRHASSKPNMQNISKLHEWVITRLDGTKYKITIKPRAVFIPPEGHYLLELDYKAIEFIVMAAEAGEDSILQAYADGRDVHRATASIILKKPYEKVTSEERRKAKTWNYLIIYGGGAYTLSLSSGRTEEQCEKEIREFFRALARMAAYIQKTKDKARVTHRVCTHFGRWQWVPEYFEGSRKSYSKAERVCVNGVVQGTAADIHKMGLVRAIKMAIKTWGWNKVAMCAHTHDSQTWYIHRSIKPQDVVPKLIEAMSPVIANYPRILVDAEVGVSWGTLVGYDENVDYSKKFIELDTGWQSMLDSTRKGNLIQEHEVVEDEVIIDKVVVMSVAVTTREEVGSVVEIVKQWPGVNSVHLSAGGKSKLIGATSLYAKDMQAFLEPIHPNIRVV